ncbi:hypothetical protein M422DRAFT_274966 [Sphaerobolus stellatus SS14]|uniref:F-box domain-containing protein n=1 Tax=Sphaerobolus stellatus (strain SS14) TaxID=990650 RepID=A0A0C9UFP9_SPHS4|nr:hypothetical protein M422DRAFT_274966 [Sphaerobolus stellatus SS14]
MNLHTDLLYEIFEILCWPPSLPQKELPLHDAEFYQTLVEAGFQSSIPVTNSPLPSCSLVCRAWKAPAQATMRRHLTIRKYDQCRRILSLFQSNPEVGQIVQTLDFTRWNLKRFPEGDSVKASKDTVALIYKCPNLKNITNAACRPYRQERVILFCFKRNIPLFNGIGLGGS